MLDDDSDLDRNGIPDSIQLDPVVVPAEPDQGPPGIAAPIEATADAPAQMVPPEPVLPTVPAADADPADLARYQQEMERYTQQMQMIANILHTMSDTSKDVIRNTRG